MCHHFFFFSFCWSRNRWVCCPLDIFIKTKATTKAFQLLYSFLSSDHLNPTWPFLAVLLYVTASCLTCSSRPPPFSLTFIKHCPNIRLIRRQPLPYNSRESSRIWSETGRALKKKHWHPKSPSTALKGPPLQSCFIAVLVANLKMLIRWSNTITRNLIQTTLSWNWSTRFKNTLSTLYKTRDTNLVTISALIRSTEFISRVFFAFWMWTEQCEIAMSV